VCNHLIGWWTEALKLDELLGFRGTNYALLWVDVLAGVGFIDREPCVSPSTPLSAFVKLAAC
jgi:hypothetical protein